MHTFTFLLVIVEKWPLSLFNNDISFDLHSLIISEVKHLFIYLCAIYIFGSMKCLQPGTFFSVGYLSFSYFVKELSSLSAYGL